MKILSKLPLYLRFLFVSYGIGLLCFTALRLLFYFHNKEIGHDIPAATLVMSFIIGLRFDVVICSYILCLPCLLLGLLSFFKPLPLLLKTTTVITITLFGIAFFIAAADIPYYAQFNSRISVAALNWADSPAVMFSVMFGEWFHWVLFLFFLVLLGVFAFLLTKEVAIQSVRHQPKAMNLLVFLLTGTLVFFGMRGRFETKSPIRWGTAFFSEYFFANQMALNPVFTFIRTGLDAIKGEDRIDFMSDKEALQLLKKNLGLPQSNDAISRRENIGLEAKRMNVVLVLMESMSAGWLERYGNTSGLTPNLDAMADTASCVFDRFYSAGIHTFNGIHSTLYGFPAPMHINPLKGYLNMKMASGLPIELGKQGYRNAFFCPHDAQFDNLGGYLTANGFDEFISQSDFPASSIVNTFGVPDHLLFDKAIEWIGDLDSDKSFFAAILTCSNHIPFTMPEDIPFNPSGETKREQAVSYSDWAIGHFMQKALSQPWFGNTLFVFLADHGMSIKPKYDMPLSYHHIPLIMLIPNSSSRKEVSALGGQMDVFPTLMGLLQMEYTNNTPAVNLLEKNRDWIVFSADNRLACLNDSLYFIERLPAGNSLYRYARGETDDILEEMPNIADKMRLSAESTIQASASLLSKSYSN